MKRLRSLLPLALFGALALMLGLGLGRDPRVVPSPLLGRPAPDFALPLLDDTTTSLRRDALLGRVWMLNVWASWCTACREEHTLLLQFAQRRLVPVYGLNHKDEAAAGRRWLTRWGNPYTASWFDADGRVGIDWGVYGVPETFVVDKAGVVRFKHVGPLTPEVLRERIEPLLRQLDA